MTREVLLSKNAQLTGDRSIALDLADSIASNIAIALALLEKALVASVTLRNPAAQWGIRIKLAPDGKDRLSVRSYSTKRLEFTLGRVEFDVWLQFFLRCCRDGAPEVDHLDVEGQWDDGPPCDLVLKCGDVRCA